MNLLSRLEKFFANKQERAAARRWAELAEQNLANNFETWVSQLDLTELISRTQKPPRGLGRYALIPIVTDDEHNIDVLSAQKAGRYYKIPNDITLEQAASHEPLFVDTAFAIGLAHNGILRALSSCYISPESRKLINVQNQGLVESKPELGRQNPALRSGLYGGFFWQDALVEGWITVGQKLGADQITIVGADNNSWAMRLGTKNKQREELPKDNNDPRWEEMRLAGAAILAPNYDHVAQRLSFDPQPDGNWQLDLSTRGADSIS